MRRFLSFIVKETKHITRDKRTMLMLFGMPIVMMLIFGFAITNDVKNVRVVVVMNPILRVGKVAINLLSMVQTLIWHNNGALMQMLL